MIVGFIHVVRVALRQLIMPNNLRIHKLILQWNLKNLTQMCILQIPWITDPNTIVIRKRP